MLFLYNFKNKIKSEHIIVFLCFVLGVVFLFDHIGLRAYWGDEAGVANLVSEPFSRLYKTAILDAHPLAYAYLIKMWSVLFGNSETAMRGFSAFFGLLMIIFIYPIGKYIYNKSVGILASFLLSTNYFFIWFGIQNKVYTLAAFANLMSCYFFIKIIREPSKKHLVFYSVFTLLGAYSHPWSILVFISQIMILLLLGRNLKNFKRVLFSQTIISALLIPDLFISLYQSKLGANGWIEKTVFFDIFRSFGFLSYGSAALYAIISIIAALFFANRRFIRKIKIEKQEAVSNLIIGSCFILPLILALLISRFSPVYAVGRYEMVVLPLFILFLANFWSKIEDKHIIFAAIPLLIFFAYKNVASDRETIESYASDDRKISAQLLGEIGNDEIVIATDLSFSTFKFYFSRLDKNGKNFKFISYPAEISAHPGWKNMNEMLKNKEKYENEAIDLTNRLKNDADSKKVYVLYKYGNPINEILREALDKKFYFVTEKFPPVPREPSWFDSIIIYENNQLK